MRLNRSGCNRRVLLTRRYAIKFPVFRSWRGLLFGLLNNLNERDAYRLDPAHRCPVLLSIPGGLCIAMPRVRILTEAELAAMDHSRWNNRQWAPEFKPDSFGWLNGEIVAVDYGW